MDYREIQISRRVSLAVLPIDDFADRIINDSSVEAFLENLHVNPIRKPDGYRVFADIKEEEAELILKSYIYKTQRHKINLKNSNLEDRILKIRLEPSEAYPAYNTGIIVRGRLVNSNNLPVKDTGIKIVIPGAKDPLICLNTIDKGEKDIYIYNPKNKCLMGAEYAYVEKQNIKGTFIIWEEVADNKLFELRYPLTFRCVKGKKFHKVYTVHTGPNGEFSLLIPKDYIEDESPLIIQYQQNTISTKIKNDQKIDLGNIKIEGE
ncbi:hypothetical protein [Defluviitalea saccharophila]|uniref:DUF4469 domain-containing protein n=1 Tax=Defluviitalea saccharophila TaxID=879970 RepID=A0ABZ2Y704_9FIRM